MEYIKESIILRVSNFHDPINIKRGEGVKRIIRELIIKREKF